MGANVWNLVPMRKQYKYGCGGAPRRCQTVGDDDEDSWEDSPAEVTVITGFGPVLGLGHPVFPRL
jgi:hypothetical protein